MAADLRDHIFCHSVQMRMGGTDQHSHNVPAITKVAERSTHHTSTKIGFPTVPTLCPDFDTDDGLVDLICKCHNWARLDCAPAAALFYHFA